MVLTMLVRGGQGGQGGRWWRWLVCVACGEVVHVDQHWLPL